MAGPLDRESQAKYSLHVQVNDDPEEPDRSRKSARMFEVKVDDVNDNDPVLSNSIYRFNASETARNATELGDIIATDSDTGVNAQLEYSLVALSGSEGVLDLFRVDSSFKDGQWVGTVKTKKALKNQQGIKKAKLRVNDKGSPPRTAEAVIEIFVEDVNDATPVFKEPATNDHVVYVNEVRWRNFL